LLVSNTKSGQSIDVFFMVDGGIVFDLAIAARRKIKVKQRYFDRAEKRAL